MSEPLLTPKGLELVAPFTGLPYASLDEESFFDEIGMLFTVWVASHYTQEQNDDGTIEDEVLHTVRRFAVYAHSDHD